MTRLSLVLLSVLSVLAAAAPPGLAAAQDRGVREGERDRPGANREPRRISEAEAQGIAQARAGGARFVGSLGLRGNSYVFRFERDGRIMDIAVDSRGG